VEINEKDQVKDTPAKDLVFEVSHLEGDEPLEDKFGQTKASNLRGNDTRTTKFSANPFEPKRRTRKFKQTQQGQSPLRMTNMSKGSDELSEDFYLEE
jgi:hypothetical protein